jgi:hypothetical protein
MSEYPWWWITDTGDYGASVLETERKYDNCDFEEIDSRAYNRPYNSDIPKLEMARELRGGNLERFSDSRLRWAPPTGYQGLRTDYGQRRYLHDPDWKYFSKEFWVELNARGKQASILLVN